ncbi:MAG: S8 family serine peptidase, partial [Firmicutes bacterium]|nr:S8 family serine peptidase [Bacillota bacterium]
MKTTNKKRDLKIIATMLILFLVVIATVVVMIETGISTIAMSQERTRSTEIQSISSASTLDDNFCDHTIIVTMTSQATRRFLAYTADDFFEIDVVRVSDLTAATVGYVEQQITGIGSLFAAEQLIGRSRSGISMSVEIESFRRILMVELKQKCRINVLNSIEILSQRKDVLSAELNRVMKLSSFTPNDSGFINQNFRYPTDQWALRHMSVPQAWGFATGRHAVTVGVIDSGINFDAHPDLRLAKDPRPNIHRNFTVNGSDGLGVPEVPFDALPSGHGTQSASIIGAVGNTGRGMAGINWNARLISMRTCNGDRPLVSSLIRAITYATSINVHVIYMGHEDHADNFEEIFALQMALDAFTGLAISPAGNAGRNIDSRNTLPAGIISPRHISVGAISRSWNKYEWSNFGVNSVHLFTYGTDILAIGPDGTFRSFSGTSAAGPLLAGVGALLRSVDLSISAEEIKSAILNNVDNLPNVNRLSVTDGRLNAHRAMASLVFRTTQVVGGLRIDGFRQGFDVGVNANIVIPEVINGQRVIAIGANAFADMQHIRGIHIPRSITTIASNSFARWNLTQTIFAEQHAGASFGFANGWSGGARVLFREIRVQIRKSYGTPSYTHDIRDMRFGQTFTHTAPSRVVRGNYYYNFMRWLVWAN